MAEIKKHLEKYKRFETESTEWSPVKISGSCPTCKGFGVLRRDVPFGSPGFGQLVPCPDCRTTDFYKLYPEVGLRQVDYNRRWADFKQLGNIPEAIKAVRELFDRGSGWLFLWGTFGTGKTMLLKTATAEYFREFGPGCRYVEMEGIIDDVRGAFDTEEMNREKQARVNKWGGIPLLCIDEMDKVTPTDFKKTTEFTILNRRYDGALYDENITIMASNKSPEALGGYLSSRIRDGRFYAIELITPDVRAIQSGTGK